MPTTITGDKESEVSSKKRNAIKVKATLNCKNCGYNKAFKKEFTRENIEMLVVSAKVMDFSSCDCGEMIDLKLEFEI
ncbi:MAG: hypothetical protein ACFFCS_01680 [Candidatus Hodarchaeota archaeon]